MKEHGIIFDCDGTLMNSLKVGLESFNYALDKLGEPPREPEAIKRYFGAAADRILLNVLDGDKAKADKAFQYYLDHQSELADQTKMHEGIRELLDLLKSKEVPMAIVTGRHEKDLGIVLKPHRLLENFVTLIADNHLPHSKPAPDGILLAAQRMNLQPEKCFYVGDSIMDIVAAKRAGSLSIAALWDPLAKAEELEREHPTYMARHPREVWKSYSEHFGEY